MKQLRKHKTRTIIITILAIAILGTATFFGARTIYNQGIHDGYAKYESDATELLTALGTAISAKSTFVQGSTQLLTDIPAEITDEEIDTYINNLTALSDSTQLDTVKQALTSYIEKWQNFKTVYASKDNNAIAVALDELKNEATVISAQIREAYDSQITSALDALVSD